MVRGVHPRKPLFYLFKRNILDHDPGAGILINYSLKGNLTMKKEEVEEIRRIAEKAGKICGEIVQLENVLLRVGSTAREHCRVIGFQQDNGLLSIEQATKVLNMGLAAFIAELNDELSKLHFPGTSTTAKVETQVVYERNSTETTVEKDHSVDPEGNSTAGPIAFAVPALSIADDVNNIADDVKNRINSDPTLRELIG
jgi:hypothetical protein